MAQGNGEMLLAPGDFLVLDSSREMEGHYRGRIGVAALCLPFEAAPSQLSYPMRMAGRRIDGAKGAGRIASSFLQSFIEQSDKLAKPQAKRLLHSLMDVLNTAVFELEDKETPASSRHQAFHLHRIRMLLNDELRDPDLTPAKIAAANGISRRYLSKLFENEGTSITRYIWGRRLERCLRELEDPLATGKSITEIAFSWGFSSASHFSRAFRERFGASPKEMRDHALGKCRLS